LTRLKDADVLCEYVVSGAVGVRTSELPLPEGGKIPDADVSPNCMVLAEGIPEVIRP
jgi:hypothetical protein